MTNNNIVKIAVSKFNIGNSDVLEAVASVAVLMKEQQFKVFLNKIGMGEKWAEFERFIEE